MEWVRFVDTRKVKLIEDDMMRRRVVHLCGVVLNTSNVAYHKLVLGWWGPLQSVSSTVSVSPSPQGHHPCLSTRATPTRRNAKTVQHIRQARSSTMLIWTVVMVEGEVRRAITMSA